MDNFSLTTKRIVIGHLTVCQCCCCGNTENGRPPVPVEWLKKEWRARGLLKRVQLSISGCLGPCDVPNVVTTSNETGTLWLGKISEFQQYDLWSTGPLVARTPANSCRFPKSSDVTPCTHFGIQSRTLWSLCFCDETTWHGERSEYSKDIEDTRDT